MKNAKLEEVLANLKEMEARTKELKDYIQSLDNKNVDAESWFLGILKELKVGRIESNYVEYLNREGKFMISDRKGNITITIYRIYEILREKFGMNECEVQMFIRDQLMKHLNWTIKSVNVCSAERWGLNR